MAFRILCLGFVVATLGACNQEPAAPAEGTATTEASPAAAASGAKACDVLTQADAEKALGRAVNKLDASGGPAGLDICQYGYEGERMMDTGNVSVTVQPVDLASLKQGVLGQGFTAEPVAGLGDEAFWSKEAGLYVGKGQRSAIYLLGIGGASEADNRDKAIALAKATVSRL